MRAFNRTYDDPEEYERQGIVWKTVNPKIRQHRWQLWKKTSDQMYQDFLAEIPEISWDEAMRRSGHWGYLEPDYDDEYDPDTMQRAYEQAQHRLYELLKEQESQKSAYANMGICKIYNIFSRLVRRGSR